MSRLLKLKHWQIFVLLYGIEFITAIVLIVIVMNGEHPSWIFSIIQIPAFISVTILFAWLYTLGVNLHKKLPKTVLMNLYVFKIFMCIPLVYFLFVTVFMLGSDFFNPTNIGHFHDVIFYLMPLHFFSIFCIFYCFYFIAKELKAVECQRPVTFRDFSGEFFLLWFFPLGIWFIQPLVNELFGNADTESIYTNK